MKELGLDGVREGDEEPKNRQSLLHRFGIPITEVDFKYVGQCTDAKKLERILLVLRSGEEGYYPDLEHYVVSKLREVDPSNRILRREEPILRAHSLDPEERSLVETDLADWIRSTTLDPVTPSTTIFEQSSVPIRGTSVIEQGDTATQSVKELPFVRRSNPDRIKSWEYDKWNRFDADAELVKMDIDALKKEEVGLRDRVSGKEVETDPVPGTRSEVSVAQRSFIEELPSDSKDVKEKSKRRTRIIIDDLNVGGF